MHFFLSPDTEGYFYSFCFLLWAAYGLLDIDFLYGMSSLNTFRCKFLLVLKLCSYQALSTVISDLSLYCDDCCITNYHQLSDFKHHHYISQFCRSEVWTHGQVLCSWSQTAKLEGQLGLHLDGAQGSLQCPLLIERIHCLPTFSTRHLQLLGSNGTFDPSHTSDHFDFLFCF